MIATIPGDTSRIKNNQKEVKLFLTFLFVMFFFQFMRNFAIGQQADRYTILVDTILITLWYGFSSLFV